MIDFPANPTVGQQFAAAGVTWVWDGAKWTASGLNVPYLPLAGGTLTGPLTLASDPTAALQAATKEYVDGGNLYPHDNRIINGDMRIDQRNNGAVITPVTGTYIIDRWAFAGSQPSKISGGRGALASAGQSITGFGYNLSATSLSAYTPLTNDSFYFQQPIEADLIADFAWGTSNAQPVTLSFWAASSVTGSFGGVIANYPAPPTRCYPFLFTLPGGAGLWTKVVIPIPGDTAGTWALQGNSGGLYLRFFLGSGASLSGPPGAWASANYQGVNGQTNMVATNGAVLAFTGVKLEVGSVATPFNRPTLAKALADCQRYFQQVGYVLIGGANYTANAAVYGTLLLPVVMRSNPTFNILSAPAYVNCSGLTTTNLGPQAVVVQATVTASGAATYATFGYVFNAEL